MKEKIAFVTGSTGDIGKAIIKRLIQKKFKVVCQLKSNNKEFKKFLKVNKKSIILVLKFDITDYNAMKKNIIKLYRKNFHIDLLVNCAGTASGSLIEMTKIEELKRVFEVNFFAQINLTQYLLRLLKKSNNASIINIGSLLGLISERGTIAYGSSKSSLMFSTKVMASEFSDYNIRVNAIAPGLVRTKMLEKMDKKVVKKMIENKIIRKIYKPSDVANKVYFLSTTKSKNINGKILMMDGGKFF